MAMMFSLFALLLVSIFFNFQIVGGPGMWEFYIMNASEPLLYMVVAASVLALLIGLFVSKYLLRLILAESIGIFGFFFSLFNHTVMNMIPFLFVAWILLFLWSPFFQKNKSL